jgi:hypothetical protein
MTDRPILFSAPMVRALLDGRKTQTRRVIDFPGIENVVEFVHVGTNRESGLREYEMKDAAGQHVARPRGKHSVCHIYSPRFAVGDRLYVREAWCAHWGRPEEGACEIRHGNVKQSNGEIIVLPHAEDQLWAYYRAGRGEKPLSHVPWKPGIHMPRWASRLTLTVTDVRVQRVQEISEADAKAEGLFAKLYGAAPHQEFRRGFMTLWNSLNAKRGFGWDANPWVAALTFTVAKRNIDQ